MEDQGRFSEAGSRGGGSRGLSRGEFVLPAAEATVKKANAHSFRAEAAAKRASFNSFRAEVTAGSPDFCGFRIKTESNNTNSRRFRAESRGK